ncbi:MAG TPA: flagellar hook capping FlgD N-terminal domain-containing protein [Acidiphilium sp.]|jgi:flagellar basal-body rod modification protein FlgD|uniref:flagellar hook assembly protein FlgD n=1 Tax=unclassified Acidiphilium TaxID=2617493 RepID=UPI000BC76571|nr:MULTISPECIES: flagellar hook capping FlgD N-terminal domain-containing protein [unclassified Acidiphilium]OYV54600.1 MAG: flagellar biosynthesis protein FlgD [Acidiphilium sp. 20-67-58]HQT60652.1 flagellar hook capping FlgD N-terminal domain-containing protein [Acidiphilium sp.]HQU12569.1 flagellar hook capping FlgD N-terminal domain-containing protein [Acidiphilium sp.]
MTSSVASVAYQQSQLTAAANTAAAGIGGASSTSSTSGTASSSSTGGSSTANALSSLSSNYNNFLTMLTTQLRNQDPTNPVSSSQFTSELVQFSQVEQQINTNQSLTQLLQLTQAGDLTQASAMLGSKVTATSSQLPLQNGTGTLNFNAPTSGPVAIAVYNSAGQQILDSAINATAGSNSWTWNGKDASGTQMPDGAYNVAVVEGGANGATTTLPFTITGTATGVTSSTNSVSLQLGNVAIPFTAVTNVTK